MVCAIIVRRHDGVQSYLILDDNPREMLRHVGFSQRIFHKNLAGVGGA